MCRVTLLFNCLSCEALLILFSMSLLSRSTLNQQRPLRAHLKRALKEDLHTKTESTKQTHKRSLCPQWDAISSSEAWTTWRAISYHLNCIKICSLPLNCTARLNFRDFGKCQKRAANTSFKGVVHFSIFLLLNIASFECNTCIDDATSLGFQIKKAAIIFPSSFCWCQPMVADYCVRKCQHKPSVCDPARRLFLRNWPRYITASEQNQYFRWNLER